MTILYNFIKNSVVAVIVRKDQRPARRKKRKERKEKTVAKSFVMEGGKVGGAAALEPCG